MADGFRLAVLGSGSVGAYIGALLSLGGYDVTLVGRQRVLDPIRSDGLKLVSPAGQIRIAHPRTLTDSNFPDDPFDAVLVTVRAYDVAGVGNLVKSLAGAQGTVLTLQNGVGSDQQLFETFPRDRVIAATLTTSVAFSGAGTVRQFNKNAGLAWAEYAHSTNRGVVSDMLNSTGLSVWHIDDPASLRWSKLLLNAVGSAQSFILDMEVSEIVSHTDLFRVEQLAFRETCRVMAAAGIAAADLPGYRVTMATRVMAMPTLLAKAILSGRIAQGRGGKPPSMLADRLRGRRKTESAYLNGAVATVGSELGVATPVNGALDLLVHRIAESEAERPPFRRNPERLLDFIRHQSAVLPE